MLPTSFIGVAPRTMHGSRSNIRDRKSPGCVANVSRSTVHIFRSLSLMPLCSAHLTCAASRSGRKTTRSAMSSKLVRSSASFCCLSFSSRSFVFAACHSFLFFAISSAVRSVLHLSSNVAHSASSSALSASACSNSCKALFCDAKLFVSDSHIWASRSGRARSRWLKSTSAARSPAKRPSMSILRQ